MIIEVLILLNDLNIVLILIKAVVQPSLPILWKIALKYKKFAVVMRRQNRLSPSNWLPILLNHGPNHDQNDHNTKSMGC